MSRRTLTRVCVFCGSRPGRDPRFAEAAHTLGGLLAERGIGLVYGGGSIGLMGIVADAALASGGEVIGVIPEKLAALELGHQGLTRLEVVDSMHTRKARMAALSDAFIALPGGYGTLEELAEVTCWSQLNDHLKPVGVLDIDGFWDPLMAQVARMVEQDFVRELHGDLIQCEATPVALLGALEKARIPEMREWIGEEQADARSTTPPRSR